MAEKITPPEETHPNLVGGVKTGVRLTVHQFEKPKDGDDYTWIKIQDPYNRRRRIGWRRVAKFTPENPPENFTPQDRAITTDEDHPPILTGAQGYAQAIEKNED